MSAPSLVSLCVSEFKCPFKHQNDDDDDDDEIKNSTVFFRCANALVPKCRPTIGWEEQ